MDYMILFTETFSNYKDISSKQGWLLLCFTHLSPLRTAVDMAYYSYWGYLFCVLWNNLE